MLPALIRARTGVAAAPAAAGPTAEEAVAACARIAATLHRSTIPGGASRTLADEIDAVRTAVDDLAPLAPAVAAPLHRHLSTVGDLAGDAGGPLVLAHGDFEPSQVLFDGPTSSLVDFDTVCRAEPALDLGQFTGHLALAVRKGREASTTTFDGGEDLASAFLLEYVRLSETTDPAALLARVAAYRTLALVHSAVRSWCRLKPERLRSTLEVLDERPRIRSRVP
jgi:aminoglycoside phosphotransferase (APT) family kinase protein